MRRLLRFVPLACSLILLTVGVVLQKWWWLAIFVLPLTLREVYDLIRGPVSPRPADGSDSDEPVYRTMYDPPRRGRVPPTAP